MEGSCQVGGKISINDDGEPDPKYLKNHSKRSIFDANSEDNTLTKISIIKQCLENKPNASSKHLRQILGQFTSFTDEEFNEILKSVGFEEKQLNKPLQEEKVKKSSSGEKHRRPHRSSNKHSIDIYKDDLNFLDGIQYQNNMGSYADVFHHLIEQVRK